MTPTRSTLLSTLLLAICFGATAAPLTKQEYKSAKADIQTKLKADKLACDAKSGNAKDVCVEEAIGGEKVSLSELKANYLPSTKHSYDLRVTKAKSAFGIAKVQCDAQAGNPKDVCRKEAEAAYTNATADAKLSETTSMNNSTATEKITDAKSTAQEKNANAQKAAVSDITDAQYKTATEKCNALAGDAKTKCLNDAKAKFNR